MTTIVVVPIYTSEISQAEIRKITGSFTLVMYTTGFAFSLIFGKYMESVTDKKDFEISIISKFF